MYSMIHARIANMNFCGQFLDEPFFEMRLSQYVSSFEKPDITLKIECSEAPEAPEGKLLTQFNSAQLLKTGENERSLVFRTGSDKIYMIKRFSSDYSRMNIVLNNTVQHPVFSMTDREYMATADLLSLRAANMGGCMLHASSLRINDVGIAFSAISGTGKSTQTGLWQKYFGERVTMINDDRPAIFFNDGTPIIHGTPFSGKTDINNNISVPLKAIIFLTRANECSIERIDTPTAYHQLANQIWRPFHDNDTSIKMLESLEKLIKTVPIYMFYCNISEQAVETVYNEIFGG